MRCALKLSASCLVIALVPASAQVDTGAILGTIRDQAEAVIPGAKVTVTNEGTGVSSTGLSRADGSYIFTPLRIGAYTVSAQFPGFEISRQSHVTVDIQQQVVLTSRFIPVK